MEVRTLANHTFDIMRNGYNRYQVDDYVERLNHQLSELQIKADLYRQRSEEMEEQLKLINTKYETILDQLSAKERAVEEMTRMATKEANVIVDTASKNADFIIKEALMTAKSLLMEVARLGGEATTMKGNMEEQLKQLSHVLDELDIPEVPDLNILNKK